MLIPASAGAGASPVPATYALSIGSQADQLGLTGTQFPAATATRNGVDIDIASYAWTAWGAGVTLDDGTIAQPTPTATKAGTATRRLTATLADGATVTETDSWEVGDADGRVQTHAVDWTAAGNAGTHTGATLVRDGVSYTFGSDVGSTAIATEGVGLVLAVAIGFDWSAVDIGASTFTAEDDVVWYIATGASILSAADSIKLSFLNAAGTERVACRVYYNSGHKVAAEQRRASTYTETAKSVASQARILALRFLGGAVAEVRYSLTAYSGTWPVFSTMTKVFATRTSNKFTAFDPTAASDTADQPALSGSIGRLAMTGTDQTLAAQAIFWKRIG